MHWQELAALGITAGAAMYIGLRFRRSMLAEKRSGRSCSGCAPPLNSPRQIPLVNIAERMTNDEIPLEEMTNDEVLNDEGMTKSE